jgi:hypothetical protein
MAVLLKAADASRLAEFVESIGALPPSHTEGQMIEPNAVPVKNTTLSFSSDLQAGWTVIWNGSNLCLID